MPEQFLSAWIAAFMSFASLETSLLATQMGSLLLCT